MGKLGLHFERPEIPAWGVEIAARCAWVKVCYPPERNPFPAHVKVLGRVAIEEHEEQEYICQGATGNMMTAGTVTINVGAGTQPISVASSTVCAANGDIAMKALAQIVDNPPAAMPWTLRERALWDALHDKLKEEGD